MKRYGLSLRHPHMRRRPAVDPDREPSFLEQMREVFAQFAPELIYNMDETRWCSISSHEITIAPRGAETVTANFSGDPKQSLTVITMINAADAKMPLWMICKRTTRCCESRSQSHFRHAITANKLILCHQSFGWTDKTIATSVIDWLSKRVNRRPHCLRWDVFSAPGRGRGAACPHAEHQSDLRPGLHDKQVPASGPAHFRKPEKPVQGSIRGSVYPGHELALIGAIEILLKVWNDLAKAKF
jgi:hypothetical protein